MYKVIKEANWTDSKGKVRNFFCYVRANNIEEATKYRKLYGLIGYPYMVEFRNLINSNLITNFPL